MSESSSSSSSNSKTGNAGDPPPPSSSLIASSVPSPLTSPNGGGTTSTTSTTNTSREPLSPSSTSSNSPNTTTAAAAAAASPSIPTIHTTTVQKQRKRIFNKELKHMMFGFGDVREPLPETVDLMEEIVFEYIQEMTLKAAQVSTKRGRFQTEDLVFLVRKDPKKYSRVIELLKMNEELKVAKRAFDDTQEPEG
ncbi:transcription initiation factor TFIID subunit [Cavenderia fasciculata]|uniref:Transcription initiation factor TFIID subunit 13 n=1 Tax=Cavenderia fasciculata TaxID=261658 RepID=F4QA84_CACFS|nr:transcription initiation factor TFIID subunit [Cavenderia fasciculata]EGG15603.1 transcription initiation factor TFIID subunit [Cavenderia fasciculata]|eukprot:XP_004354345.1 transcription initiation factor TFIID subunit [Cavenderia fasciculata]